jgi:hypothetical protein
MIKQDHYNHIVKHIFNNNYFVYVNNFINQEVKDNNIYKIK